MKCPFPLGLFHLKYQFTNEYQLDLNQVIQNKMYSNVELVCLIYQIAAIMKYTHS